MNEEIFVQTHAHTLTCACALVRVHTHTHACIHSHKNYYQSLYLKIPTDIYERHILKFFPEKKLHNSIPFKGLYKQFNTQHHETDLLPVNFTKYSILSLDSYPVALFVFPMFVWPITAVHKAITHHNIRFSHLAPEHFPLFRWVKF